MAEEVKEVVEQPTAVKTHTKPEYINLQRIASGFAFGPVPELYNTMDWINEYELIQQKKSKLSAKKRAIIVNCVESATSKYEEDQQNGNTERYDNMQKVVEKFIKFTQLMKQKNQIYG